VKSNKAIDLKAAPVTHGITRDPLIGAELDAVEATLNRLLDSNESQIAEICHYLIDGGGKRLRPTFIMLVYRACGGTDKRVADAVDAAAALELIHSATLLHDDIIDAGTLRRGRPSAFARYGFAPSLVAGDYLFCRAFELCGRFEESLVLTAARACIQLTEGEAMEGRMRHQASVGLSEYMAVITRKTASLFDAGGRVAAQLADASPELIEKMARLGNALGLSFQMIDDLLDVLGPEHKIGKPVGSDLRAGIPSLPVVLAAECSEELKSLMQNGAGQEEHSFARMLEILRAPAIINRARRLAAEQLAYARHMVYALQPSPYRDSLVSLIEDQEGRET
jgi:octaprenyl-diphosphate synthase